MTTCQASYVFFYYNLLSARKQLISASIYFPVLKATVGQKKTTYQPPFTFLYWRLLLVRKWPYISLHKLSCTAVIDQKMATCQPQFSWTKDYCWSENDHISASIHFLVLKAIINQTPVTFLYWRILLVRKWPGISLHSLSCIGGYCWSENGQVSASIHFLVLEAIVGQKMARYQPPFTFTFLYWRLLLVRKWPAISLHSLSCIGGYCWSENGQVSASIHFPVLEAIVGQKMARYQPPFTFLYWRILLVRKWPGISLHSLSCIGGYCWSENGQVSASIHFLVLEAIVGQKMARYQPPFTFLYWRLLLVRKWPGISLHSLSCIGGYCWSENGQVSASIH